MLSRKLEKILNKAFGDAKTKRHEFMTVEHLLLALVDDAQTSETLVSAGAQVVELKRELKDHIDAHVPKLPELDDRETQPTLGFQRVLQRAVFHVQSNGRKEVSGFNVLVAIFSEHASEAVSILAEQGVTRADIVNLGASVAGQDISEQRTTKPDTDRRLHDLEQKLDQVLIAVQDLSKEMKQMTNRGSQEE